MEKEYSKTGYKEPGFIERIFGNIADTFGNSSFFIGTICLLVITYSIEELDL